MTAVVSGKTLAARSSMESGVSGWKLAAVRSSLIISAAASVGEAAGARLGGVWAAHATAADAGRFGAVLAVFAGFGTDFCATRRFLTARLAGLAFFLPRLRFSPWRGTLVKALAKRQDCERCHC